MSKAVVAVVGVFMLVISGVAGYAFFGRDPKISEEEAKVIAEEYTNGTATSVELEYEWFTPVYEVAITNATGHYEVEVDGNDGSILEVEDDDDDDDDDDEDEFWDWD